MDLLCFLMNSIKGQLPLARKTFLSQRLLSLMKSQNIVSCAYWVSNWKQSNFLQQFVILVFVHGFAWGLSATSTFVYFAVRVSTGDWVWRIHEYSQIIINAFLIKVCILMKFYYLLTELNETTNFLQNCTVSPHSKDGISVSILCKILHYISADHITVLNWKLYY